MRSLPRSVEEGAQSPHPGPHPHPVPPRLTARVASHMHVHLFTHQLNVSSSGYSSSSVTCFSTKYMGRLSSPYTSIAEELLALQIPWPSPRQSIRLQTSADELHAECLPALSCLCLVEPGINIKILLSSGGSNGGSISL